MGQNINNRIGSGQATYIFRSYFSSLICHVALMITHAMLSHSARSIRERFCFINIRVKKNLNEYFERFFFQFQTKLIEPSSSFLCLLPSPSAF